MAAYIAELIGFVLLIAGIAKWVAPYVAKKLDERRETVRSTIDGAAAMLKAAEDELAHRQALLEEARKEADVIRARAASTAEQLRVDGHERAEQEYQRLVDAAAEEIGRERQRALDEVSNEVGRIVVDAAERVVRSEVDAARQRALVDEVINAAAGSGALQ